MNKKNENYEAHGYWEEEIDLIRFTIICKGYYENDFKRGLWKNYFSKTNKLHSKKFYNNTGIVYTVTYFNHFIQYLNVDLDYKHTEEIYE